MGAGNRVLEDATHTFAYDDAGNLVLETAKATGRATVYRYDHRNRLVRAEVYAAGLLAAAANYGYDPLGRLA